MSKPWDGWSVENAGYEVPLSEQTEPQLRGTMSRLLRTRGAEATKMRHAIRAELKRRKNNR